MEKARLLFDPQKAFDHLKHLAVKIGPRLTGSTAEHQAAKYIARMFRSFGLQTRLQKFPVTTFHNKKCVLKVQDKGKWRAVPCEPVMPTKSTPPGGLTGDIYFAESGEAEYLSPKMRDKIVFVYGRVSLDDLPQLLSYRPKALVHIDQRLCDEIGHGVRSLNHLKTYGNLPMAGIGLMDGLDIIKKKLKRAHLTMTNITSKSHSFNVVGEKKGDAFPDEIVVICGHYDSHMNVAGAQDNASGTAIMMELARVLAATPTSRTLRFIGFAAEETGLCGSTYYAERLVKKAETERKKKTFKKTDKTECEKHRLVFNLDVHGELLARNEAFFSGVDDIGASVRLLAKETGCVVTAIPEPWSSDGTALAAIGIPALQFSRRGGVPYGHTAGDVIKYLSPEGLGIAGRFAQMYLRRYVTDASAFPFPREIPEKHMKKLVNYFAQKKRKKPAATVASRT